MDRFCDDNVIIWPLISGSFKNYVIFFPIFIPKICQTWVHGAGHLHLMISLGIYSIMSYLIFRNGSTKLQCSLLTWPIGSQECGNMLQKLLALQNTFSMPHFFLVWNLLMTSLLLGIAMIVKSTKNIFSFVLMLTGM